MGVESPTAAARRPPPSTPRAHTSTPRAAAVANVSPRRLGVEHAERELHDVDPGDGEPRRGVVDALGTDAEASDLAGRHEVLELLEQVRRDDVGPVQLVHVDVVGAQPAQAGIRRPSAGERGRSPAAS